MLALLVHADMCNADQLRAVCAYHARTMLGVVARMEDWAALPEHLQEMVSGPARGRLGPADGAAAAGAAAAAPP